MRTQNARLFQIPSFLLLLTCTSAVPVLHDLQERNIEDNPFSTGPIGPCTVPTAQQLPVCSQYISYPVPEALLSENIAAIREKAVDGARKNAEARELAAGDPNMAAGCGYAVQELECYRKFPSCTKNDTLVEFVEGDCEAKIKNSCTDEYLQQSSCSRSNSNHSQEALDMSTCNKVTTSTYDYKYCHSLQGWSDVYMTEWMNVSLIDAERDIEAFAMFGTSTECVALYTELKCGEAGRCWDQGSKMEINSTRELCESVLSCVSSAVKKKLEEQISCSSYPSQTEKLSTPPTEITEEPTAPLTTPSPSPVSRVSDDDNNNTEPRPTTDLVTQADDSSNDDIPLIHFPYPDRSSGTSSLLLQSVSLHMLLLTAVLVVLITMSTGTTLVLL